MMLVKRNLRIIWAERRKTSFCSFYLVKKMLVNFTNIKKYRALFRFICRCGWISLGVRINVSGFAKSMRRRERVIRQFITLKERWKWMTSQQYHMVYSINWKCRCYLWRISASGFLDCRKTERLRRYSGNSLL